MGIGVLQARSYALRTWAGYETLASAAFPKSQACNRGLSPTEGAKPQHCCLSIQDSRIKQDPLNFVQGNTVYTQWLNADIAANCSLLL